jgi:uncharacterized protein DUF6883/uncharacterized protein DUF4926
MKLPNPEQAYVDVFKVREYCLSRTHPRGRHKARLFASALGITAADAEILQRALLDAAIHCEATVGEADRHGQRFVLDFEMTTPRGKAMVRAIWIVRRGEEFPRMVTCFVLWGNPMTPPKLLDVVALRVDLPERGLVRGQVGTIVQELGQGVLEVEFSDDHGRAYATLALTEDQFLVLHHQVVAAD